MSADRPPAVREEGQAGSLIRQLSVIDDRHGWGRAAGIAAGLVGSMVAAWIAVRWESPAGLVLVPIAQALAVWTQHAAAEEVHEGVHYRILSARRWNDVLATCYAGMIGVSFAGFRVEHFKHHRYFGSPLDPDYVKYVQRPEGAGAWLRYFATQFTGYAAIRTLLRRTSAAGGGRETSERPFGMVLVQLALLAISAALVHPLWHLVVWMLPLLTVTYGMTQFRTLLEHWSPQPWLDPVTGETRVGALHDFDARLQRHVFAAPFGYNYHGSHHQYASVPEHNLSRLRAQAPDGTAGQFPPMLTTTYFRRVLEVIRVR